MSGLESNSTMIDDLGYLSEEILWGVSRLKAFAGLFGLILMGCMPCIMSVACIPIKKATKVTKSDFDEQIVKKLRLPLSGVLQAMIALALVTYLNVPDDIAELAKPVVTLLLVITGLWFASRAVDILSKSFVSAAPKLASPGPTNNDDVAPIITKLFKFVFVGLILVIALQAFGIPVTSLIAGLGVGGLAIGFALQSTLANMFASAVIYSDKPFELGDHIKIGGIEGTVEEVGIRSSKIRGFDGSLNIVPNANLESAVTVNYFRSPKTRLTFSVKVLAHSKFDLYSFLGDLRALVVDFPGAPPDLDPYGSVFVTSTNGFTADIGVKTYLDAGPLTGPTRCALLKQILRDRIMNMQGKVPTSGVNRSTHIPADVSAKLDPPPSSSKKSTGSRGTSGTRKKSKKKGTKLSRSNSGTSPTSAEPPTIDLTSEGGETVALLAKADLKDQNPADGVKQEMVRNQENNGAGMVVKVSSLEKTKQEIKASWDYWPCYLLFREILLLEVLELVRKNGLMVPGDPSTVHVHGDPNATGLATGGNSSRSGGR